ncbi:MAG TPA: PAS domain S-box protein, partial [Armatimonadota bacterium]
EEIDILAEMADDLSYGMTVIRTRDDRTKAVDALGRSEEKYRDLVQNANSIILRWNTDGTISFFNEFAQSFFGYKESEIIGKSVIGTIVPEKESSGRDLVGLINRIVGHPTRYKTNINENMRKNGERVWVAWTNKPVFDEHGHVKELLSVGLDVTELTAARHALEQSEERYKSVFDSNAAGFVLFDLEGNIVDANPKACVLYGYACEDLIGRNCRSFVDTEYYSVFDHFLETPLGQWYNAQFVNVRRDGTKFQTEVFGTRLLFGSQERFLAIIQDITELKRVEEEKKKFYRKTIESATEGKLVISDEGDIRSIVGAPIVQCDITSAGHLAGFRSLVAREAESAGMSPDRIYDIVLCAGEASTNVIKHAGHGKASIHRVGDRLIVVVSDEGPGIEAVNFPEVALKKGYTTAVSLGMGFKAMISIADRVYLATGSGGTTVGIEMRVNRREGKQPTINVPDTW